ncbi:MAG: dephospho-CoA kinase, partial [Methylococcaceae bacterium]|nr:dephospho-CoA kinase [Methylococcaceae bacterium]
DGSLNRDKLRQQVFADAQKKQQLDAILHPLIYAQIEAKVLQLKATYCIISIPLLIETAKTDFVDRILVIDCPMDLQIARVQQRDKLTKAQIHSIIASQASRENRLAVADDVIENTKTALQLAQQVKKLHNLYLLLSKA